MMTTEAILKSALCSIPHGAKVSMSAEEMVRKASTADKESEARLLHERSAYHAFHPAAHPARPHSLDTPEGSHQFVGANEKNRRYHQGPVQKAAPLTPGGGAPPSTPDPNFLPQYKGPGWDKPFTQPSQGSPYPGGGQYNFKPRPSNNQPQGQGSGGRAWGSQMNEGSRSPAPAAAPKSPAPHPGYKPDTGRKTTMGPDLPDEPFQPSEKEEPQAPMGNETQPEAMPAEGKGQGAPAAPSPNGQRINPLTGKPSQSLAVNIGGPRNFTGARQQGSLPPLSGSAGRPGPASMGKSPSPRLGGGSPRPFRKAASMTNHFDKPLGSQGGRSKDMLRPKNPAQEHYEAEEARHKQGKPAPSPVSILDKYRKSAQDQRTEMATMIPVRGMGSVNRRMGDKADERSLFGERTPAEYDKTARQGIDQDNDPARKSAQQEREHFGSGTKYADEPDPNENSPHNPPKPGTVAEAHQRNLKPVKKGAENWYPEPTKPEDPEHEFRARVGEHNHWERVRAKQKNEDRMEKEGHRIRGPVEHTNTYPPHVRGEMISKAAGDGKSNGADGPDCSGHQERKPKWLPTPTDPQAWDKAGNQEQNSIPIQRSKKDLAQKARDALRAMRFRPSDR